MAQLCVRVMLLCFYLVVQSHADLDPPFKGHPASPFIGQGKARVTTEEKEKNEREKKASRIVGSFFSFMQVPSIL